MSKDTESPEYEELIKEIVASTEFCTEEVKDLVERFNKQFPKGYVSQKEFIEVFGSHFKGKNSDKMAKILFVGFDRDANNKLDVLELCFGLSLLSPRASIDDKIELAFDICDADKNRSISKKELQKFMTAIYYLSSFKKGDAKKLAADRAKSMFRNFDTDLNQKISLTEFKDGLKREPEFRNSIIKLLSGE